MTADDHRLFSDDDPWPGEHAQAARRRHRRTGPARGRVRSPLTDTGSFLPPVDGGAGWGTTGASDTASATRGDRRDSGHAGTPDRSRLSAVAARGPARVEPGPRGGWAVALAAGVVWLVAVVLGFVVLRPPWVALALLAGVAAVAAGVRGFPLAGLVPLVLGVLAWGLAAGGQVPDTATDVPADFRLLGWVLAYSAPLLVAYVAVVIADARKAAVERVTAATALGRWWGGASADQVPDLLRELEAIPSAQFVVVPDDGLPHLVVAGRRVALVQSAIWPPGRYLLATNGDVLRDGRPYAPAGDEIAEMAADVRAWAERLEGAECCGFVVVQDLGGYAERVTVGDGAHDWVQIVRSDEFAEVVGGYLAVESHRIDVDVMERLDESLRLFAPPTGAATEPA